MRQEGEAEICNVVLEREGYPIQGAYITVKLKVNL